jgi:hypothetical protein
VRHGPRTVPNRGNRTQLRRLRAGVRALRMPHRRTTVPRRFARAGRGGTHGHPAAKTVRGSRHGSHRDGPGDRHRAGQTTHRSLPEHRRDGRRGARRHHRANGPVRRHPTDGAASEHHGPARGSRPRTDAAMAGPARSATDRGATGRREAVGDGEPVS